LGTRVSELLALPAQTFELFVIDGPVAAHIERLQTAASSLGAESRLAGERLGLSAGRPGEIYVGMRNGELVVFPSREAEAV
jgi:hypothetical protein